LLSLAYVFLELLILLGTSDAGYNTTALLLKKLAEKKISGFTDATASTNTASTTNEKSSPSFNAPSNLSSKPSIHVKLKGFGKGR
jgi:hypothetical protein